MGTGCYLKKSLYKKYRLLVMSVLIVLGVLRESTKMPQAFQCILQLLRQ